jgi:uncharacterized protein YuzE
MKTTRYFEEQVLRKRPTIERLWCAKAIAEPIRRETQEDGRIRFWLEVTLAGERERRVLRVVTLEDGETVHNAFFDRWPVFKDLPGEGPAGPLPQGAGMKLHYYPETDSLYIELKAGPGRETREVAPGVNADFAVDGTIVGLDIEGASKLDLGTLEAIDVPLTDLKAAE